MTPRRRLPWPLWAALALALSGGAASAEEPLPAVRRLVESGKAVLVDVRERNEWDAFHLREARLVPMSTLVAERANLNELPKDRPIYLHCAVGGRAAKAAQILKAKGLDARPLLVSVRQLVEAGFAGAPGH